MPTCQHGNSHPWIKPGVSKKTGEPYDGFYGEAKPCGCKVARDVVARALPQQPMPAPPVVADYDNKARIYPAPGYSSPPPTTAQDAPRTQTKPEVDWDAVNRLSAAQTALDAAAQAYQGAGLEGETNMYQCFAMNYKLLMGCKIGGEVDQLIESIAHVQPRAPGAF